MSRRCGENAGGLPGIVARTTDLRAFARELSSAVAEHGGTVEDRIGPNPRRDALLVRYRQLVREQIEYDVDLNLGELRAYAARVSSARGRDVLTAPGVVEWFDRLESARQVLDGGDLFGDGRSEEAYWLALRQFYLDGLSLAEHVWAVETGRSRRILPRAATWYSMGGMSARSRWQSLVNMLEVAVPHPLAINPIRTYLPTLAHLVAHVVNPWKRMRFHEFEESTLGWTRRGGFRQYRPSRGPAVELVGCHRLRANPDLFESPGGPTRHNVIVACCHRAGFLDFPLYVELFRGIRHAFWINNAFYGPGMGRKILQDGLTLPVRGQSALSRTEVIERTTELLVDRRVPLLIFADGTTPQLMYGYQSRVKRGLRLAVDAAVRASASTRRATFVVPVTFNDPLGFIRGQQDRIVVTVHEPIRVESPFTDPSGPRPRCPGVINDGDDLLNHLEALFILHSAQASLGLRSPRIVPTVRDRRARLARQGGLRRWLEARFHASVSDLARDNT